MRVLAVTLAVAALGWAAGTAGAMEPAAAPGITPAAPAPEHPAGTPAATGHILPGMDQAERLIGPLSIWARGDAIRFTYALDPDSREINNLINVHYDFTGRRSLEDEPDSVLEGRYKQAGYVQIKPKSFLGPSTDDPYSEIRIAKESRASNCAPPIYVHYRIQFPGRAVEEVAFLHVTPEPRLFSRSDYCVGNTIPDGIRVRARTVAPNFYLLPGPEMLMIVNKSGLAVRLRNGLDRAELARLGLLVLDWAELKRVYFGEIAQKSAQIGEEATMMEWEDAQLVAYLQASGHLPQ